MKVNRILVSGMEDGVPDLFEVIKKLIPFIHTLLRSEVEKAVRGERERILAELKRHETALRTTLDDPEFGDMPDAASSIQGALALLETLNHFLSPNEGQKK